MSLDLAKRAVDDFCINPYFQNLKFLCYVFQDAAQASAKLDEFNKGFDAFFSTVDRAPPENLTVDFMRAMPKVAGYLYKDKDNHVLIVGINTPPGNETFGIVLNLLGKPQYILPGPACRGP